VPERYATLRYCRLSQWKWPGMLALLWEVGWMGLGLPLHSGSFFQVARTLRQRCRRAGLPFFGCLHLPLFPGQAGAGFSLQCHWLVGGSVL